ncbi:MAG TPA: hypothetical protein VFJ82_07330 [Longimicrobium sp.]|nr:hypothetical protein [Longimicrobium sp.]
MNLDIRLPIGGLFTLLGLILTGYGALGEKDIYERSLGHNVNLTWGVVVLLFGAWFLYLGRKGTSSVEPAAAEPAGRATEAREHALGLEDERPRPHGH